MDERPLSPSNRFSQVIIFEKGTPLTWQKSFYRQRELEKEYGEPCIQIIEETEASIRTAKSQGWEVQPRNKYAPPEGMESCIVVTRFNRELNERDRERAKEDLARLERSVAGKAGIRPSRASGQKAILESETVKLD